MVVTKIKSSRLYNESPCFLFVSVNIIDLSFLKISVSTVGLEKHNKFWSQKSYEAAALIK